MPSQMELVLAKAQDGNDQATQEILLHLAKQWERTLQRRCGEQPDPALTYDDIEQCFVLECWRHMPHAKHPAHPNPSKRQRIGSPMLYLAHRGIWAVGTYLRACGLQFHDGRRSMIYNVEDLQMREPKDETPETELVIERLTEQEQVRVMLSEVQLREPQRRLVDAIMDLDVPPGEPGYNKVLASHMGVCPQRVSQLLSQLREATAESFS